MASWWFDVDVVFYFGVGEHCPCPSNHHGHLWSFLCIHPNLLTKKFTSYIYFSHVPTVDDRQINRCYCFYLIHCFFMSAGPAHHPEYFIHLHTCILYLCAYTKKKHNTHLLSNPFTPLSLQMSVISDYYSCPTSI